MNFHLTLRAAVGPDAFWTKDDELYFVVEGALGNYHIIRALDMTSCSTWDDEQLMRRHLMENYVLVDSKTLIQLEQTDSDCALFPRPCQSADWHISNSSQTDGESPVTLRRASREIGVSAAWLRRECIAGRLPHLNAGAAYLVDLPLIRKLLLERARGCQVTPD